MFQHSTIEKSCKLLALCLSASTFDDGVRSLAHDVQRVIFGQASQGSSPACPQIHDSHCRIYTTALSLAKEVAPIGAEVKSTCKETYVDEGEPPLLLSKRQPFPFPKCTTQCIIAPQRRQQTSHFPGRYVQQVLIFRDLGYCQGGQLASFVCRRRQLPDFAREACASSAHAPAKRSAKQLVPEVAAQPAAEKWKRVERPPAADRSCDSYRVASAERAGSMWDGRGSIALCVACTPGAVQLHELWFVCLMTGLLAGGSGQ